MTSHRNSLTIPIFAVFLGGLVLGWAGVPEAWAAPSKTRDVMCRTFKHALEDGTMFETSDRTSEVGQWVGQHRENGWDVVDLDFEVTQKPNGFPMGFVQVCLENRS